jgi:hypothetical protein
VKANAFIQISEEIMSRFTCSILAAAAVLTASHAASAAVFSSTPSDVAVINSASWLGGSFSGPGSFGSALSGFAPIGNWDGTWRAAIMLFQLPTNAIPTGEAVVSANFDYAQGYKNGTNPPSYNLDVVAYRLNTQGFITPAEYSSPGSLIQDNFINPATPDFTLIGTSAAGDANLVNYLNANYAAGSANGANISWIALRVQMDATGVPYETYMHNTYNGSLVLSFATAPIPEPMSATALAAGASLVLRRRRNCK